MDDQRLEQNHPRSVLDPELSKKLVQALGEIARAQFSRQRSNHTLQPTALVNELWIKILRSETEPPSDMRAFRAWAATAIRNILISYARAKAASKRGGERIQFQLECTDEPAADRNVELLELDDELVQLKKINFRAARVIELRFFGGMSHAEVARELGISARLSQKTWAMARSWLSLRLQKK